MAPVGPVCIANLRRPGTFGGVLPMSSEGVPDNLWPDEYLPGHVV